MIKCYLAPFGIRCFKVRRVGKYREVLIEQDLSHSDKMAVRQGLFLTIFLQVFMVWGSDFTGIDVFQKSLSSFNGYQTKFSCTKVPLISTPCSNTLESLVKDEKQDRAVVIESMVANCKRQFEQEKSKTSKDIQDIKNPELLQQAFERNQFAYLGEFSNQSVKSCLNWGPSKNNAVISKFYYYAARLNETAAKISQEQIILDRYLEERKASECPNPYLLASANQACQKAQSCLQPEALSTLAVRVQNEETLYEQAEQALKTLPKDCGTAENCGKAKAAYSQILTGLIEKNPWFLNSEFRSERTTLSMSKRLQKYMKLAQVNLKSQQEKIQKTAMCLHHSDKENCDLDEIREVLSLTRPLLEKSNGTPEERVMNKYMRYQTCVEDATLDRNRTGKVFADAFRNAGLGILVLPIGARWAAGKIGDMALRHLIPLVGADVALNVLSSQDTWSDAAKKCLNPDEMSFQFKKLSAENSCKNSSGALSSGEQDRYGCLVNAGLATLSTLPFVETSAKLVRYAQSSGLFKAAPSVVAPTSNALSAESRAGVGREVVTSTKGAQQSTGEVKSAATGTVQRARNTAMTVERRQHSGLKEFDSFQLRSEIPVESRVIPNLPSSMRLVEGEKVDGTKSLFYKYPEKLHDGTWVASKREFQLDEATGAINANFPAGREFFEMIAREKSGKAYFAFFDVGSLRYVNTEFKAGEAAGDRYLNGVADKIKQFGEGKITLARTGGDEFGLIIDEVDPAKAKALLEKIQNEIRKDLKGDAKRIFFEEKKERAREFREAIRKLETENPDGVSVEQKAAILKRIEDLARVQQPDVSIGIAQIGHEDSLFQLMESAEEQAKRMKISTALQFGRSAEKYGSKEIPNARPKPMYLAPVQDPLPSSTWQTGSGSRFSSAPSMTTLRAMNYEPKEEVARIAKTSVVRFEDESGRTFYKTERYITDAITGKRLPIITEIPTVGKTRVYFGHHPEGEHLIGTFIQNSAENYFVMPKVKSLKYFNYFEAGSKAGDQVLEATAEVIQKNTRSSDLNFKFPGADFLMGLSGKKIEELAPMYAKISEEVKKHPKVIEVLRAQDQALTNQLAQAQLRNNLGLVKELKQRLQDLRNFDLDLQFQALPRSEMPSELSVKEIRKKLDAKFEQANKSK